MNTLPLIGERLSKARKDRGLTLDDIAAATRINIKSLQDIDEGRVPGIPQTYVRAFIKAYAQQVGIDAEELLSTTVPSMELQKTVRESSEDNTHNMGTSRQPLPKAPDKPQAKVLFIIISLIVLGLTVTVYFLRSDKASHAVQEISFSDVMKEREAQLHPPEPKRDSIPSVINTPKPIHADSLHLEAVASESVWVHLVIDGNDTKEYILTPMYRIHWKAKKLFVISIGNAGGLSLTLNGKQLGTLGKGKTSVRNVTLSWETLDKLQKEITQKEKGWR